MAAPADVPPGWVDPTSVAEVTAVLATVQRSAGATGLADLLGRIPGARVVAGTPRGLFRAATPARVWLGSENAVVLSDPPVHEHVVGGVVLHRAVLAPGTAPATLAPLIVQLAAATGAYGDTSAALTAVRDVT